MATHMLIGRRTPARPDPACQSLALKSHPDQRPTHQRRRPFAARMAMLAAMQRPRHRCEPLLCWMLYTPATVLVTARFTWSCGLLTKAPSTTARSPISSVSPWTSPDFAIAPGARMPVEAREGMNLMACRRAQRRSILGHLPKIGVHQACTASRPYLLKHRDDRRTRKEID
jgi:hypothetical protein